MNTAAFSHPAPTRKQLANSVTFNPVHTKALWDKVWAVARAQDWYNDQVMCVANDGTYFYFQQRGLTTGYARVKV